MKRYTIVLTMLAALLAMLLAAGCSVLPEAAESEEGQLPLPKALSGAKEIELSNLIQEAAAQREDVTAFIIFRVVVDRVDFSKDGQLALVWLALVDKDTGYVQPGEPGLVIARRSDDPQNPWRLIFQADADFAEELMAVPEEMLAAEVRAQYMPGTQKEQKAGSAYGGYRLPWRGGETVRVTGSIGHVYTYKSCPSACLYAFDFANGSMFDVVAAKQGTVKYAVWKYPNGNTKNANYLVLEDTTTNPTTYQVYLHLAQNSIPAELRTEGAKVVQGQYIGKADDTGFSTGHHLHFHVHTNYQEYWGKSVDIVFEDVPINKGRPRTCGEARAYPQFGGECMPGNRLTSQNGDAEPPTGEITSPAKDDKIRAPTITLSGWMKDDSEVVGGQLYYKTLGDWKPIGEPFSGEKFTQTIDICAARIPNGNFTLGLQVTDRAGNVSQDFARLDLVNKYNCPAQPPVCTPAADEIALHNETGFQGVCQLVKLGEYADLDSLELVKSDQALSVQVGEGVTLLAFAEPNFAGTMEFFQNGDDNLANNLVGAASISSLRVVERVMMPLPPEIKLPDVISSETELTVTWAEEAGVKTQARLSGKANFQRTLDWQTGTSWTVGTLPAGNYKLSVEAGNLLGSVSTTQEFKVLEAKEIPSSRMDSLPQTTGSTAIRLSWVVETAESEVERFELQTRKGDGEWEDYGEPIAGSERSLVYWGSVGEVYEFRLRAVSVLNAAEAFTENAETRTFVQPDCLSDTAEGQGGGDNERDSAPLVNSGTTVTHNWCPVGDVDWVRFSARQGDSFVLRAVPRGAASAAVIQLYDAEGATLLGEAHPQNADSPSTLNWKAAQDGTYAVKLTPLDNRVAGVDAQVDFTVERMSSLRPGLFVSISALLSALLGGSLVVAKRVQRSAQQKSRRVGW